jgi:hypothetical protein
MYARDLRDIVTESKTDNMESLIDGTVYSFELEGLVFVGRIYEKLDDPIGLLLIYCGGAKVKIHITTGKNEVDRQYKDIIDTWKKYKESKKA